MRLIKPSYSIEPFNAKAMMRKIEKAGRTCYKSEDKITNESAPKFIRMIIDRGHESVLEHSIITVKFICDRGVSHELVRHRIASFSQESTRYCNYSKDKYDNQLTFVIPVWTTDFKEGSVTIARHRTYNTLQDGQTIWYASMWNAENTYLHLLEKYGWQPQQARSVLPNSLKTEIVVTANLREWREIFRQRTSKAAHPQMRELMCPLLDTLKKRLPVIFNDITY